ncbi:MAG: serine/threonine-protein kinase [Polyangiaceae bacterium]
MQRTQRGGKRRERTDAPRLQSSPTRVADMVDEASAVSESRVSLVGQVLADRYRIERRLGEGAMGQVYLAEHVLMRKHVALKILHGRSNDKPDAVARFEREAVAASHVEHPNVATAKDFGQLADGSFFLVLEYLDGIVLRSALGQYGALAPKRALHIATQICSGLVRAHELGIVHRDLKPENIMLVARGDDPDFVKILDFGIARVPMSVLGSRKDDEPLTRIGMVHGTPAYMAPEQAMGHEVDARADLYALGVLLYEMLTGARPFVAPTEFLVLTMHVSAPIPPMRERAPDVEVDPRIEAFVRTLLAKEPSDRPADAYEVEAALLSLAEECGFGPQRSPSVRPSARASVRGETLAPTTLQTGEIQAHAASIGLDSEPVFAPRRKAVRIAIAAAAPLLLIAIVSVVSLLRPEPPAVSRTTEAMVLTPPSGAPIGSLPPAASTASAMVFLERCEVAEGRVLLERSQASFEAPSIQQTIATHCFAKGRAKEAIAALTLLAKQNADLALTPTFLTGVESAAAAPVTMDVAYTFLEQNPHPAVADLLYRLSLTPGSKPSMARAERALRVPAMRERASRSLAVALALKEAGQGCEAVPYFAEAEKFGDGRALAYLELLEPLHAITYRKVPGKKAPVPTDAYACLDKGGQLKKAIAAIKSRLAR